jgi:oligogalacturonide transporter
MQRDELRVPFGRKLAFALGDVFGGGSFNIVNFLYPGYLALIVGLPAAWAGAVMMIARIWDAVTDPIMGRISDATRSPMGKRRIYILVSAPLVILAMVLMFFPYAFDSLVTRFIAAMLAYMFFCTVQTMVMIPYMSLSSELAVDYTERARLNSLRLGFSIFSSILCVAVPGMVVDAFRSAADPLGKQGYIAMSLIFGTLFCLCLLATALGAKEQIHTPPVHERFDVRAFVRPLRLRPFRQYLGMQMCLGFAMAIMSSLFFMYVDFYLMRDVYAATGSSGMLGLLSAAVMFAMQIVGLPFYLWFIGRTSKTAAYRLGSVLWIASGLALLAVRPGAPDYVLYILAAMMGLGISGPGLAPHTMLGDVADTARLAFHERSDGTMGGVVNFISTVSQAIAISAAMAILGYFGFLHADPGQTVLAQPETAQTAIRVLMSATPLVLMGAGILISFKYKINAAKHRQIKEAIENDDQPEALLKELMPR